MSALSQDVIQVPNLEGTMPPHQCNTDLNCFGRGKITLPRLWHRNPDFEPHMAAPAHWDLLRESVRQQCTVLHGHAQSAEVL